MMLMPRVNKDIPRVSARDFAQSNNKQLRPANLIDVYRIVAAFTIIFFHSNYINEMGGFQKVFIYFKLVVCLWTLPFFYSTMAAFALRSNLKPSINWQKRWQRLARISQIIGILIIGYEGMRWLRYAIGISDRFRWFELVNREAGIKEFAVSIGFVFKTVNFSAGYYFSYVLIIYMYVIGVAIVMKMKRFLKWWRWLGVIVVVIMLLDFEQSATAKIGERLLIDRVIGFVSALAGIVYVWWVPHQTTKKKPVKIVNWQLATLILMPMCVYGLPHLWWVEKTYPITIANLIVCLGVLYLGDKLNFIENYWGRRLSEAGHKYSLGIFIIHPFIMAVMDNLIPWVGKSMGINNQMVILVLIYGVGMGMSYKVVKLIYSFRPGLITLS